MSDFALPGTIFQIGVAPFRIDVICNIDGLTFDEAYATSVQSVVYGDIPVRFISLENRIANKLAAARPQDLIDVTKLRMAPKARNQS